MRFRGKCRLLGLLCEEIVSTDGMPGRSPKCGNVVILDFSKDISNGFTTVIVSDDWSLFPEAPELFYSGEATSNTPEIVVDSQTK